MRLRPFKPCDAENLIRWSEDIETFRLWGGYVIGEYPLSANILNGVYYDYNGRCLEEDNFYPMTAFDDEGMLGHFIMRYLDGDNKVLRFGWVIVDSEKRGQHLGKNMLELGLKYAFEIFGADKVTIGVFEANEPAYKCYLSTGFHKPSENRDHYEWMGDEQWKVVELEITREDYETE